MVGLFAEIRALWKVLLVSLYVLLKQTQYFFFPAQRNKDCENR